MLPDIWVQPYVPQSLRQQPSNGDNTDVGANGSSVQGSAASALGSTMDYLSSAQAAVQPHLQNARSALQPHVDAAMAAAQPHLDRAKAAAQGYLGTQDTTQSGDNAGGGDIQVADDDSSQNV
jgi:hypothetical protein